MDPLKYFSRELCPHILLNLEPAELLASKQVSHCWHEVVGEELDRKIFLEYAPKGETRETYRTNCGVESAENLTGRVKAFLDSVDKNKTIAWICTFPFNPGLVVAITSYPSIGKYLQDHGSVSPMTIGELLDCPVESANALIQRAREENLSVIMKADHVVKMVAMKRLSDVQLGHVEKMKKISPFYHERPHLVHMPYITANTLPEGSPFTFFISDTARLTWIQWSKILDPSRVQHE